MSEAEDNIKDINEKKPLMEGLVDAKGLVEALFPDPASRPCIRTIRRWQELRFIPYLKIGGGGKGALVFFDPIQVRRALDARFTISAK